MKCYSNTLQQDPLLQDLEDNRARRAEILPAAQVFGEDDADNPEIQSGPESGAGRHLPGAGPAALCPDRPAAGGLATIERSYRGFRSPTWF